MCHRPRACPAPRPEERFRGGEGPGGGPGELKQDEVVGIRLEKGGEDRDGSWGGLRRPETQFRTKRGATEAVWCWGAAWAGLEHRDQ